MPDPGTVMPSPATPEGKQETARSAVLAKTFNQVSAFQYVAVPLAPTYRAIVQIFFEAKQQYAIELRPAEVFRRIEEAGYHVEVSNADELDTKLAQLVEWGNLTRNHDTDAVSTIRDFYRRRYVYHLSAVGEAAHRAVLEVEATVGKSGSLQATMLAKIRDVLRSLATEGSKADPEPDRLLGLLHDLHGAFATLTQEANRFIGDLNRHADVQQIDEERFALRKRAVLAYVSRFVDELRRLAGDIAAGIAAVEQADVGRLIACAARSKDLPPEVDGNNIRARWTGDERKRWNGLSAWFLGPRAGGEPTVDRLASVAVAAVVSLTRALGRLNERRSQPVDRAADFRTLAQWFSECESDEEAHQLWQTAFGLYPARHFHLEEDDEEDAGPRTSWWDAPPAPIPVAMRARARVSRTGRASAVPDYADHKRWIAQTRRREREQLDAAVDRFAGKGLLHLSDVAELDAGQFDLLLALLDQVLVAPRDNDGSRSARSSDGRLRVALHHPATDPPKFVRLRTPRGLLRCLDYAVEVSRTGSAARGESEGRAG